MNVFYIKFSVFDLNFRRAVYGYKEDYTKEQLQDIKSSFENETEQKLRSLGYFE